MSEATDDYMAMLDFADGWGPEDDPERRWFLAGWIDQRDGSSNTPPNQSMAAMCAYNSGRIAQRDHSEGPRQ